MKSGSRWSLPGSVSFVAALIGILLNLEAIAELWNPVAELLGVFLPIMAWSGIAGGVCWIAFELWRLHPSYRRQREFRECVPELEKIRSFPLEKLSDVPEALEMVSRIQEMKVTLEERFQIPCIGSKNLGSGEEDRQLADCIMDWKAFSSLLLPRARHGDLKNARNAIKELGVPLAPFAWGKEQKRLRAAKNP